GRPPQERVRRGGTRGGRARPRGCGGFGGGLLLQAPRVVLLGQVLGRGDQLRLVQLGAQRHEVRRRVVQLQERGQAQQVDSPLAQGGPHLDQAVVVLLVAVLRGLTQPLGVLLVGVVVVEERAVVAAH